MLPTLPADNTDTSNIQMRHTEQVSAEPKPLDLLTLIDETASNWQIHRCQLVEASISQTRPMQLIYHYEALPDATKAQYLLQGQLLKRFDEVISREDFAAGLGIAVQEVPQAWQLKFTGKLVLYHAQPDIALRLHWTNTLKDFVPIYQADLATAVAQSFAHWQWVRAVEVVNRDRAWQLVGATTHDAAEHRTADSRQGVWQLAVDTQFSVLPPVLADAVKQSLQADDVSAHWVAAMQDAAQNYADNFIATQQIAAH